MRNATFLMSFTLNGGIPYEGHSVSVISSRPHFIFELILLGKGVQTGLYCCVGREAVITIKTCVDCGPDKLVHYI